MGIPVPFIMAIKIADIKALEINPGTANAYERVTCCLDSVKCLKINFLPVFNL